MSASKQVRRLRREVRFLKYGLVATWVLLFALLLMGQASPGAKFIEAEEIRVGDVTITESGITVGPSAVLKRTLTLSADRLTLSGAFDTLSVEPGAVALRGLRGRTTRLTSGELKMVGENHQELHLSNMQVPLISLKGMVRGAVEGTYITLQNTGK